MIMLWSNVYSVVYNIIQCIKLKWSIIQNFQCEVTDGVDAVVSSGWNEWSFTILSLCTHFNLKQK